jgi:hypothetical protein
MLHFWSAILLAKRKIIKGKANKAYKGANINLIEKPLDSINAQDLKQLIENQVLEKKSLDYKLSLPSNADADKKEFLADVSSFANSSGGDIIYGISQDNTTGFPKDLVGIDSENIDQEILRLESIIREGIEPRIPSVAIQPIKLANSKNVLILRIQKSWVLPHRIKFKEDHRFYARGTNGKYKLDLGELRNAFTLSESLNDKIKRFREDRIARLFANETPIPFQKGAKVVLHLIPLISFNPSTHFDLEKIEPKVEYYAPLGSMSWGRRYNLDGLISFSCGTLSYSYTQLFRNGIMEIVDGTVLDANGNKVIPSIGYEEDLRESFPNYLSALKYLNVELPIVAFLTLIGVKGYKMATSFFQRESYEIDRDVLLLPETVIESYAVKPDEVLKPAFDAIWNSCGFPKSLNYDDKGEWKPNRR